MKNQVKLSLLITLTIFFSGCGYNVLQKRDEAVKAAWSNVQNEYQKRADLVTNLVNVVQAAAGHEKGTLTAVIEARSKATSIQVTPETLNNPDAMKRFGEAQGQLTQALSRLMVVSERYPELKANQNFLALQNDLKQIEQTIAKRRATYIKEVQDYNIVVRSFPTNLTAWLFGHNVKANFAVEDEKAISRAPKVEFNK